MDLVFHLFWRDIAFHLDPTDTRQWYQACSFTTKCELNWYFSNKQKKAQIVYEFESNSEQFIYYDCYYLFLDRLERYPDYVSVPEAVSQIREFEALKRISMYDHEIIQKRRYEIHECLRVHDCIEFQDTILVKEYIHFHSLINMYEVVALLILKKHLFYSTSYAWSCLCGIFTTQLIDAVYRYKRKWIPTVYEIIYSTKFQSLMTMAHRETRHYSEASDDSYHELISRDINEF